MQKIFVAFLKFLSRLTGKNIVYFNPPPEGKENFTAVKSPLGFWYAGNVRNGTDIAYGILNSGMVEPEETKLVIRLLKQLLERQAIVNFYDIGANTGYYGILSAFLAKGKIRTFAFEPLEENYKYLKESVYLNRLEEYFKIFTLALGDKNSEEIIYGSGTGASLNKEFLDMPKPAETIVAVKKLDDLVKPKLAVA